MTRQSHADSVRGSLTINQAKYRQRCEELTEHRGRGRAGNDQNQLDVCCNHTALQIRSVAQRPETLRLLRAGPGGEKQVEVHALLHVVVPGAARYAKPNSFGLRHHVAFTLALESVLRVRGIAHAGIDRSAQGNNCYEPLLHSSTRFHGFSVNNFSLYPFRGERFFPLSSDPSLGANPHIARFSSPDTSQCQYG